MSAIECFIPSMSGEDISTTVESLNRSEAFTGVTILSGVSLRSTETLRSIAEAVSEKFILIYTKDMPLEMGMYALERMLAVAEDTGGFAKKGYYTVDLYMNSNSQCRQWGDRGVTIYVL